MTDTQLYLIAVLCAFCAGICFASAWQAWRAARNLRAKRPGYVRPSLHAFASASPGTVVTLPLMETCTESSGLRDIREAFTVGHEALADRLKTPSPTPSGSGTASSRGAPTMDAEKDYHLEFNYRTGQPVIVEGPIVWGEAPWRSNVSPHTDTDAA